MKWILTALMLLSLNAEAGTYFTGSAGLVQYGHEDNKWYQDGHTNRKSYTAPNGSLGIGNSFSSNWSIEANARYLHGGWIKGAEWEQDSTYGNPSASHAPTDFDGTSRWNVYGLSLDAVYIVRMRPIESMDHATMYVRGGIFAYKEIWRSYFQEGGSYHLHISDCQKQSPVAGLGFRFGDHERYSIEITKYFDLQCQEGGVASAKTVNFGLMWK